MKCPRCGYFGAKYTVSRKKKWKGKGTYSESAGEPRKDFTADCPKCGFHYDARTEKEIKEKKE